VKRAPWIATVAGISVIPLIAASQSPPSGARSREGFDGSLSVLNKGAPLSVPLTYRTWMIPEGAKVDELAEGGGNLVVEVAAGAITTIIDGQKQARQFGEFFVVSAGHRLQIVTTNRSAILHILRLGP
jgi:hypothetical protein